MLTLCSSSISRFQILNGHDQHRASKKELEVYFEIQFNRIVDVIENRMEQDGNDCCRQFPPSEEINPLNEAQVSIVENALAIY